MTEHTATIIQSGSWKVDLTIEDSGIKTGNNYSVEPEMTIEVNCSCGEEFQTIDKAMEHLREVSE